MRRMDPYRIGSGAGYAGDRIDPAQALAEHGRLNALVFECLAERTIALAQLRRSRDPPAGLRPAAGKSACAPCCRPACASAPPSSATWARPTPWRPGPRRWRWPENWACPG
jgi:hypothetical protein